jgi:hypothetical protein
MDITDTTPSPADTAATHPLTLAERAHLIMHPPPPPPSAAVLEYVGVERALSDAVTYRRCVTDVRRRLRAAINESTVADGVSDPMITGDEELHNCLSTNDSTVVTTTSSAVVSASVMSYTHTGTHPPRTRRRRRRRTTVPARPTLLRRRLVRTAAQLRLTAADARTLTDALPLITRRCGLAGPPRVTVRRHHAAATLQDATRRRAELNDATLDDAVRALGLHAPASHGERQVWQRFAVGTDTTLVADADAVAVRRQRAYVLAQHRLSQTLARTRIMKARLQVLATAVVESLQTRPEQRVELENDGTVRLHTARVVVTRDEFCVALCEHLLARQVVDPRRAVLRVAEQIFKN